MKNELMAMVVGACALMGWADKGAIEVDFGSPCGPVKPVNGVGQPPLLGYDNFRYFSYLREAGIPYSRLHDTGGAFGKNIFVDIPNLFRDFDADENDPKSYDFAFTDLLLKALVRNGVEPYFRLGVTIENAHYVKAYRIHPPKDFAKWARICEHVIRHYTEGWADGYRMKISHWEIWNEPEGMPTAEENSMWKGPFSEYIRLYVTAAKHLKAKFPHLMIGGYGGCGFYGVASNWGDPKERRVAYLMSSFTNFLAGVKSAGAPLDFFSFHCYDQPPYLAAQVNHARKTLDAYGFTKTQMSLNEWMPTVRGKGTAEQASDIIAMLTILQNGPVDDAEIYDARMTGGTYSPLFNSETYEPRKAYFGYLYFNELRKLGTAVRCTSTLDGVWACAAKGNGRGAVLVANTTDRDVPLRLKTPGAQIDGHSRIIDRTRTDGYGPVPRWLPPASVALLTYAVEEK